MSTATAIEWTDATWNPCVGCSILSPGCVHCYAMSMAARIERMNPAATHYAGLTQPSKAGPVWTGKMALAPDSILLAPLRWKKPRRVFVNSMSDLFHESVPDDWIDRVFAVMALTPQHTYQVLTKRAKRMSDYMSGDWDKRARPLIESMKPSNLWNGNVVQAFHHLDKGPLPNVWLGVSTERQQEADERIPFLLATPAAKRFISAEPLLGPVDLDRLPREPSPMDRVMPGFDNVDRFVASALMGRDGCIMKPDKALGGRVQEWWTEAVGPKLDWVIVGGESGPMARPSHPDWFRALRDQCAAAEVPFFFKQWGSWYPWIDRDKDDADWRKNYGITNSDPGHYQILNLAGGCGFHGDRVHMMRKVSKASAGHFLDGREIREFPT